MSRGATQQRNTLALVRKYTPRKALPMSVTDVVRAHDEKRKTQATHLPHNNTDTYPPSTPDTRCCPSVAGPADYTTKSAVISTPASEKGALEPTRRPLAALAVVDSQADHCSHPGRPVEVVGGSIHPDQVVGLRAEGHR
jgi:hypothetical protein